MKVGYPHLKPDPGHRRFNPSGPFIETLRRFPDSRSPGNKNFAQILWETLEQQQAATPPLQNVADIPIQPVSHFLSSTIGGNGIPDRQVPHPPIHRAFQYYRDVAAQQNRSIPSETDARSLSEIAPNDEAVPQGPFMSRKKLSERALNALDRLMRQGADPLRKEPISLQDIKKSYRLLARKLHPDMADPVSAADREALTQEFHHMHQDYLTLLEAFHGWKAKSPPEN